jgi:cytochrome o ubiquinol oxidase subunit 2
VKIALSRQSLRTARTALALGVVHLCAGCGLATSPIIDAKGPIAAAERDLMYDAVSVMLIVIIPVFVLAFWFSWHYRASNTKARYDPTWAYSGRLDFVIWSVPILIVAGLAVLSWNNTHKLDPYRPLASTVAPLEVQAVAQDWKWLFIYPEQKIAVVNQLVFPSGTPLNLKITSDTVMNSFFIPTLGSQIFAMAGMETRLHLLADEPGSFVGRNMQYSGAGFADQRFEAIAMSQSDFDAWVAKVGQSAEELDADTYRALAKPSKGHPVTYYSTVEPDLFDKILAKYSRTQAPPDQALAE